MTTNLVHNAIVHNLPDQGAVLVTTGVHAESAVLTVENTGAKLTPQLVATLAEPFQRGTQRIRTDHAGVGLGLAIVKSIAQAHDGTLTLSPRAGGGTLRHGAAPRGVTAPWQVTPTTPTAPRRVGVEPVMEFSVLGPLEVRAGGRAMSLGSSAKPRGVLAFLLLHAGESVSADRLALALCGDDAPASTGQAVQVHVSRLRKSARRRLRAADRRLPDTPCGSTKANSTSTASRPTSRTAAERLAAGHPNGPRPCCDEALALWRGPPLADFACRAVRADRDRAAGGAAARRGGDAHAGRPRRRASRRARRRAPAAGARAPVARAPARPRMLALYRSGRQADALEAYRQAREVLVEQLGIEPGPELPSSTRRSSPTIPGSTAARRPPARRGALPAPPNRTIGREPSSARSPSSCVRPPAADAHRAGRRRQDPPRARGRARRRARLPRRRALRGAGASSDARSRAGSDRRSARRTLLAGESAEQAVERFLAPGTCCWSSTTASTCSAPPVHRQSARPLPRRHGAGHEPRTARPAGRATLPVPPLALPEPARGCRRRWPRAAVALFCERARAHDPDFDLTTTTPPPSRRSAAGSTGSRWRSSSPRPAAACSPAELAGASTPALGALGAGAARRARPPADAARDDRLEPRPARRGGEGVLRALRGLHRRRHGGGGRGRHRRRARHARPAGRQEPARAPQARRATRLPCSRRSALTPPTASPRAPTPRPCGSATTATSSRSPRATAASGRCGARAAGAPTPRSTPSDNLHAALGWAVGGRRRGRAGLVRRARLLLADARSLRGRRAVDRARARAARSNEHPELACSTRCGRTALAVWPLGRGDRAARPAGPG